MPFETYFYFLSDFFFLGSVWLFVAQRLTAPPVQKKKKSPRFSSVLKTLKPQQKPENLKVRGLSPTYRSMQWSAQEAALCLPFPPTDCFNCSAHVSTALRLHWKCCCLRCRHATVAFSTVNVSGLTQRVGQWRRLNYLLYDYPHVEQTGDALKGEDQISTLKSSRITVILTVRRETLMLDDACWVGQPPYAAGGDSCGFWMPSCFHSLMSSSTPLPIN